MAFWSSQRIKAEQEWAVQQTIPHNHPFNAQRLSKGPHSKPLISDFEAKNVKHGAYELSLGEKYLITPSDSNGETSRGSTEALKIPPGQFALLYTKEKVDIPLDVIAFISLKGSVKFKGLINISGFQVDPGFPGFLKFSVYNASGEDVHLNFDEPCFLIWFADLDAVNELYTGDHKDQSGFTPDDRDRMCEERHSPETLSKRIEKLERSVHAVSAVGLVVIIPLIIGFVTAIFDHWFGKDVDRSSNGEMIIGTSAIVGCVILLLNSILNGSVARFVRKVERDKLDRE